MKTPKPEINFILSSVSLLIEKDYFPALIKLIDNAKSNIELCIFSARYYEFQSGNIINYFFHALRRAAARGVQVRMLLNQNFGAGNDITHNMYIVQRFKGHNFQAAFAGRSTRIHAKLILIDNAITVLGSHNVSGRANANNFETSAAIVSADINAQLLQTFERLWENRQLVQGKIQ